MRFTPYAMIVASGLLASAAAVLPVAAAEAPSAGVAPAFRDPATLHVRPNVVERPGPTVFEWGRRILAEQGLEGKPAPEIAAGVAGYIHENFAFTPDRPPQLTDFLEAEAGNCYAHARLAAFLLRLAGVPARFVYEVHLELKTPAATESARERGIGLFGQYHNDHFWLLVHDGERWVPFDSTLGIAGYDDFIRVKVDEPRGGVANPPFVLWQEAAEPGAPMQNVTAEFWRESGRDTVPGVPAADWRALLDEFSRLEVDDLMQPLSEQRQAAIARVARAFFDVGGEARAESD